MDQVLVTPTFLQPILTNTLIGILVLLVAFYFYVEYSRVVQLSDKLPGPKRLPLISNLPLLYGIAPSELLSWVLKNDVYGPVSRISMGTIVAIFIYHPRDLEVILSSSVHIDKSPEYKFFKPWLGDGLLISTGQKWRAHRKIIVPAFHMNVLKTFVPLFYENSHDLVLRLRSQVGKEFDCHDYLSQVTVDILMETAMGVRGADKKKSSFEYAMAVMKLCNVIHRRQYDPKLRLNPLYNFTKLAAKEKHFLGIIHGLTNRLIEAKKQEIRNNVCSTITDGKQSNDTNETEIVEDKEVDAKVESQARRMRYVRDDLDDIDENDVGVKKRLAFLDLMLEIAKSGAGLSEEEVREEVNTIMFEGHDTTAAGSSFVLCVLGIHQDIQERVYEELNEIFQGSDRQCTFQDTLEMKYLERVIFETLRLFPPVPAIARKLNQDAQLATRQEVLPKDSTVIIPIYRVHRLEEYYPNPEEFNPDNFLPEKMQQRHFYAFIPFSAGPRSCVGRKYAMLKLKVLLSTILRNYRIVSDLTEKDFLLQVDIILKRTDGFRIKLEPRNNTSCYAQA